MPLLKTSNPALNSDVFRNAGIAVGGDVMTLGGTVNRTGILLFCAFATAAWTWSRFLANPTEAAVMPPLLVGGIGGLVMAMVTIFKKEWSPITAPAYALLEGLVLGGMSALLEVRFPGIAMQAVGLTFGTLLVLLLAYQSGLIRATEKFKLGIVAATGGIFVFYMVTMVLGFFGVRFTAINGSGPWGIAISLFIVSIAALNLILDFDFIQRGVAANAPKYMEWYGAFGLMVTLVWLYLEMLRLLSQLRSRD